MLMCILNCEVYFLLESLLILQHAVYLKSTVFNHIQFPVLPTLHKLCCVARYTPFILTIAWCNPISLPINIIHTCFSKRSQALGAASLPHTTFQTRAISSSCNALQSEQLYSQQCRHHSLPFQLKQLSKFPKREMPTQFTTLTSILTHLLSQQASQSSSNASSTTNQASQWQAVPRTWTDRSTEQRQGPATSAGNGVSESEPYDKMAAWLAEGQREMAWDGVGYIRSEGGYGR